MRYWHGAEAWTQPGIYELRSTHSGCFCMTMSIQNIILHMGDDCVGKAIHLKECSKFWVESAARKELKPE